MCVFVNFKFLSNWDIYPKSVSEELGLEKMIKVQYEEVELVFMQWVCQKWAIVLMKDCVIWWSRIC